MNNQHAGVSLAISLNDYALSKIKGTIRAGVSELNIHNRLGKLYSEAAGTDIRYEGDILSGERTALIGGEATERTLRVGDTVILDMQPFHGGCCCDTTRTYFIGEPDTQKRRAYKLLEKALAAGAQAIKPGVSASDIHKAVADVLAEAEGMSFPHHAGHGLCAVPFQEPIFLRENHGRIEEGMIVALEPGLYNEHYGMRIEDNFIVTNNGCKKIGTLSTDMDVFIIL